MVSSWHRIEIGNHIDLLTGFPFSSEHYTEDPQDIRLLRGDNVVQGTVRWEGVKRWPASQAADLERYQVAENDIVIAMDRTWVKAGLKIAQIRERDLPSLLVQRVARLRTRSGLDQNYLAQCIISYRFEQYVKGNQTETAVPHISSQQICEFTIPIPSIQEQRQIAAILTTWDEAVDKLGSLYEAKLRRRDGIAQSLLVPVESHSKSRNASWKKSTFGAVFTERQDRNCGLDSEAVVTVGKYAIRKQSEHFTRSVASSDLSNYWTISPGDFVYDPMSAYYGALGQYTGDSDGIVSPAYRVIRLSDAVMPAFMVYLLKSHRVRFLLETRSSQGNKEGKRRLLQRDEFDNIDFLLPPKENQCRIAKILAAFEDDLEHTATLIEAMKRQKHGLMQKLLTGEWRVRV